MGDEEMSSSGDGEGHADYFRALTHNSSSRNRPTAASTPLPAPTPASAPIHISAPAPIPEPTTSTSPPLIRPIDKFTSLDDMIRDEQGKVDAKSKKRRAEEMEDDSLKLCSNQIPFQSSIPIEHKPFKQLKGGHKDRVPGAGRKPFMWLEDLEDYEDEPSPSSTPASMSVDGVFTGSPDQPTRSAQPPLPPFDNPGPSKRVQTKSVRVLTPLKEAEEDNENLRYQLDSQHKINDQLEDKLQEKEKSKQKLLDAKERSLRSLKDTNSDLKTKVKDEASKLRKSEYANGILSGQVHDLQEDLKREKSNHKANDDQRDSKIITLEGQLDNLKLKLSAGDRKYDSLLEEKKESINALEKLKRESTQLVLYKTEVEERISHLQTAINEKDAKIASLEEYPDACENLQRHLSAKSSECNIAHENLARKDADLRAKNREIAGIRQTATLELSQKQALLDQAVSATNTAVREASIKLGNKNQEINSVHATVSDRVENLRRQLDDKERENIGLRAKLEEQCKATRDALNQKQTEIAAHRALAIDAATHQSLLTSIARLEGEVQESRKTKDEAEAKVAEVEALKIDNASLQDSNKKLSEELQDAKLKLNSINFVVVVPNSLESTDEQMAKELAACKTELATVERENDTFHRDESTPRPLVNEGQQSKSADTSEVPALKERLRTTTKQLRLKTQEVENLQSWNNDVSDRERAHLMRISILETTLNTKGKNGEKVKKLKEELEFVREESAFKDAEVERLKIERGYFKHYVLGQKVNATDNTSRSNDNPTAVQDGDGKSIQRGARAEKRPANEHLEDEDEDGGDGHPSQRPHVVKVINPNPKQCGRCNGYKKQRKVVQKGLSATLKELNLLEHKFTTILEADGVQHAKDGKPNEEDDCTGHPLEPGNSYGCVYHRGQLQTKKILLKLAELRLDQQDLATFGLVGKLDRVFHYDFGTKSVNPSFVFNKDTNPITFPIGESEEVPAQPLVEPPCVDLAFMSLPESTVESQVVPLKTTPETPQPEVPEVEPVQVSDSESNKIGVELPESMVKIEDNNLSDENVKDVVTPSSANSEPLLPAIEEAKEEKADVADKITATELKLIISVELAQMIMAMAGQPVQKIAPVQDLDDSDSDDDNAPPPAQAGDGARLLPNAKTDDEPLTIWELVLQIFFLALFLASLFSVAWICIMSPPLPKGVARSASPSLSRIASVAFRVPNAPVCDNFGHNLESLPAVPAAPLPVSAPDSTVCYNYGLEDSFPAMALQPPPTCCLTCLRRNESTFSISRLLHDKFWASPLFDSKSKIVGWGVATGAGVTTWHYKDAIPVALPPGVGRQLRSITVQWVKAAFDATLANVFVVPILL